MKKFIAAYSTQISGNPSNATFVAQHFNMIDLDENADNYAVQIRATSPANTLLIYYFDMIGEQPWYPDYTSDYYGLGIGAGVNSHEDWFLHDSVGNRLTRSGQGWYLMDPASGWRNYWAQRCVAKINMFPAGTYDGIFADDVMDLLIQGFSGTVPLTQADWENRLLGMVKTAKSVLGSKILILNMNDRSRTDFVLSQGAADGLMIEGGLHPSWWGYTQWYTNPSVFPLPDLQYTELYSAQGKYVVLLDGIALSSTPSANELAVNQETMLYCLCVNLLCAKGSKVYTMYNDLNSPDGKKGYYPEMDSLVPGNPLNDRYLNFANSPYFFRRDFENATVLVNIGMTASPSVIINGVSYTVPAHQAVYIATSNPSAGVTFSFSSAYKQGTSVQVNLT